MLHPGACLRVRVADSRCAQDGSTCSSLVAEPGRQFESSRITSVRALICVTAAGLKEKEKLAAWTCSYDLARMPPQETTFLPVPKEMISDLDASLATPLKT
eukprot:486826-Hanusia_phi.AAC.1